MFNERQVISDILKGNHRGFEILVKQYERLVFHVIGRLVSDKEAIEDVCQDVFIKVHQSLQRFKFESKLSTWIARIAYLTAINYIRKKKNEGPNDYDGNIDNYHFTIESPESILTRKDTLTYLNRLIEQLPLSYRTVLTLYHLDEFSCKEIEEITGIPEGTIKSHLFRARKLLKEKIQTHFKNEML